MTHEIHKRKISKMRDEVGYEGTYHTTKPKNAKHITPNVKSGTEVLFCKQNRWRRAIIHVPKTDNGKIFREKYRVYYSQKSGNISGTYAYPTQEDSMLVVSMPDNLSYHPQLRPHWKNKGLKVESLNKDGSILYYNLGIYVVSA
tara:strand:- start:11337 stop:11768 length:432 start_codon:yes stop_codon:yes gene_type:complete